MQTLFGTKQEPHIKSDPEQVGAVGGVSLAAGCPVHWGELFSGYSQLLPGGKVGLVLPDFCLFR